MLVSFIGGLGGRDITDEEFFEIAAVTHEAVEKGDHARRRDCSYTDAELREVRKLQAVAHVEREELRKGRDRQLRRNAMSGKLR